MSTGLLCRWTICLYDDDDGGDDIPLAIASAPPAAKNVKVFLFQPISVTMRRINAILLHNCFVRNDPHI